ncbi:MAG: Anthranilate synthase component 1 [Syntrophorhabdus sp. PtaU1.Bin002]|nr:MAG: Anthranilate synthase component 1 [Syntrophorhabdus sp. PtaB.Bin006]OPY71654.1 MAG: Anthranilate synthase component 1 [Syntrophorhabdus sp. PtaU1.Bin002]
MSRHTSNYHIIPYGADILADLDTPLSCYMKLKKAFPSSPSFLLESVESQERLGRYSVIGFDPFLIFKSIGNTVTTEGVINQVKTTDNPLAELRNIMAMLKPMDFQEDTGFTGGAVGYVGYDVVNFFEQLPDTNKRGLGTQDMYFMFPKKLVVFDNVTRKMMVVIHQCMDENGHGEDRKAEGRKELAELLKILRAPLRPPVQKPFFVKTMDHHLSKEEFEEIVVKAKEYIFAGDIIQVVLSQRFRIETDIDGLSLYRALRVINPSPYMFFMDCLDYGLIGSSPEILVKMEGTEVEVRPIAGTRPRGRNAIEDEILARELLSDEKERAEHIMLVDLGRNDVGRVAEVGSVVVPELMNVDKYSHVMHMVSSVKGTLREGLDAFDVFQATFPAGTVTGAPKVRAMEIIEELEKEKREFYAGCVGYFGYNGNMDFCITIRTMLKKGDAVYLQAGAGIVADSRPENEYFETIHKSEALVRSIMGLKEMMV